MAYQILICCLFTIAVCNGERLIRRGMGLDKEKKATITSSPQKGVFQTGPRNGASGADPDFYFKPRYVLEKQKIDTKVNGKMKKNKSYEPVTTNSQGNQFTQRKVQARASDAKHEEQRHNLTNQALRRRTMVKCKGPQKIVECKDDVPEDVCKNVLLSAGVEVVSDMPNTAFFAICVSSEEEALLVAELTDVAGVEDDPPRTLSYFPGSEVVRQLQSNEQIIPYGVQLVKAPDFWSTYGTKGGGVKVCVIDTGLRITHEDLKDGDLSGSNDNGLVTPWDQDGNSHGTHVSGTIAATDNDVGVVGVAPDVSIHVVRVFNNAGEFVASNIVDGMNACASAGANIISMSLGGPIETSAERSTVQNLKNSGILLVAASGNDANGLNLVEYPAGYEPVLSVGAVDSNFEIAPFSTHNTEVDIAGPGVDVLSTTSSSDQSYSEFSGTSMAAPHIAGVAALLWSQFPESSVDDIQNALQVSARDYGACGKDRLFGNGVVDVMAAAAYLESGSGAAPELGGCVDVSISLTTDDWGQETFYIITLEDDVNNIVYRGGPYQEGLRTTYTDNIKLQEDCYNLILLDAYGDGSNNPEHGIGEIGLTYKGNKEVEFNNFAGSQEVFQFGNCGGDNSSPTTSPVASPTSTPVVSPTSVPVENPTSAPVENPTSAPVENPTLAPVESPTIAPVENPTLAPVENPTLAPVENPTLAPVESPTLAPVESPTVAPNTPVPSPTLSPANPLECTSGESLVEMTLATDQWSLSENYLYLFDDASSDMEWVWIVNLYELEGNTEYVASACLVPTNCYKFYFFDQWGDGLASGGLTLKEGGNVVLQISPGDNGSMFEAGAATTYWYQEFGTCTSISHSTATNENF